MIVIELGKLRELPNEEHRECSVCGIYKPNSSYHNEAGKVCRTNCYDCYVAPSEKWEELKKRKQYFLDNPSQEVKDYKQKLMIQEVSVSVEDMIDKLKKLPKGSRLIVTQSGYYAEGKFADIYFPIEEPKLGKNVYSIGNSNQNN